MQRKLTLRRQGLLQGRHAPPPPGLPSATPSATKVVELVRTPPGLAPGLALSQTLTPSLG